MKKLFFFSLIFFLISKGFGQIILSGSISDSNNTGLSNVSIVVESLENHSIIGYTYSDEKGFYKITINTVNDIKLVYSSMGYQSQTIEKHIDKNISEIVLNLILYDMPFELNEVVLHIERPIVIKKDTITYSAKSFLKGNEEVVEDLLKNLPGISVDTEGTIRVGNQEIEKIMVEGDDLFEKGYNVLSKNMPVHTIEKVELLQRYSNNNLLKNIENSDKVALNLILTEGAKRSWFGNVSLGYGLFSINKHEIHTNLMNFGKKNKFYFLTNFNNIGKEAVGDVNNLIKPYTIDQNTVIGDEQRVENFISTPTISYNLKKERSNFNNTKLLSLNSIFNLSDNLKVKSLFFFNLDEQDWFKKTIQNIRTEEISITNNEDYQLKKNSRNGFSKVDAFYTFNNTLKLETTTKFNFNKEWDKINKDYNNIDVKEYLNSKNTFFDQAAYLTKKINDQNVYLIKTRYINEKAPQRYAIDHFFYTELFPDQQTVNNILQQSTDYMDFLGLEFHFFNKKPDGRLLEYKLGNQYRSDKLKTIFSLLENNTIINNPEDYQNNINYKVNDFYFIVKYQFKIKEILLSCNVDLHSLSNNFNSQDISKTQKPFFINPSMDIKWEINDINKLKASYYYNKVNTTIQEIYGSYILTEFNTFSKGTEQFNQLTSQNIYLNYELGNWNDEFFVNTKINYTNYNDYFTQNSYINQNFVLNQKIKTHNRDVLNVKSNADYYVQKITSNIKFEVNYLKTNYENFINDSQQRKIKITGYNYEIGLRSGFKGLFNYYVGTKWMFRKIILDEKKSYSSNVTFVDLYLSKKNIFNAQLKLENYFFKDTYNEKNSYLFLDFILKYDIKNSRFKLSVIGNNLFNTKVFKSIYINDLETTSTEYKLLTRFGFLKLEYRF